MIVIGVLDFTGKLLLTKTVKISGSTDSIRVQTAYTYDHSGRVTGIDQSYNGGTAKRIAGYAYNALGQLVKKNLGRLNTGTSYPYDVTLRNTVITSTNAIAQNSITLDSGFHVTASSSLSYTAKIRTDYLQALDYRYNIRGQLLSMNNATLAADTANNADVNDVFGMEMLYDKADGSLGNTAYYNGRLSAVKGMTRGGTAYGTKSAQRAYNYSYDELNRLTDASYYEKATGGSWVATGAYDEKSISYDMNGNILALKRNGVLSGAVKRIDSLVYSYDGNQLTNITDGTGSQYTANGFKNLSGSSSTTPYSYDDNGNLTTDLKKGIVNHYNILNRVDSIRVTAGTNQWISYTYDATGTLLRKKQYNISGTTPVKVTDYIDGFVYENSSLVYFAAAEGRVRDSANVLTNEYVITDTQGNSRVSFEDNGNGIAKIRQENSYYPFGLVMGNSTTPAANANKNLYNAGSEWQNDYADLPDYYQTFFRNYDASIGRFVGVDPQAASAESWTVYQYAYNNPGMLNDPMGDLTDAQFQQVMDLYNKGNITGNYHFSEAGTEVLNDRNAFIMGANYINDNGLWGVDGRASSYFDAAVAFNIGQGFNANSNPVNPQHMERYYVSTTWYRNPDGSNATINGLSASSVVTEYNITANAHVGVGQPGTWEGLIPIWGSGRAAVDDFQNGNYWTGAFHTALAISDVFLVKAAYTALSKAAVVGIGKLTAKEGLHVVYQGVDKAGIVRYAGITSRDFAIREAEHKAAEGTGRELLNYFLIDGAEGLTKTEARIWEQTLINQYGLGGKVGQTGQLLNKINSIAESKWITYGIQP